jgi:hypothetical protein
MADLEYISNVSPVRKFVRKDCVLVVVISCLRISIPSPHCGVLMSS